MKQVSPTTLLYAFGLMFLGYVFQNLVVFPLETVLRSDASVELYSLVYLPHGLKSLVVMLTGGIGLVSVFFAQLAGGVMIYGSDVVRGAEASVLGSICFLLTLVLLNQRRGASLLAPLFSYHDSRVNFYSAVGLGLCASLLNGTFSALYWGSGDTALAVMFVVGDTAGTVVAFAGLLILLKYFRRNLQEIVGG